MNLIPEWMYWVAIAALTAIVGVQEVHVSNVKTELAQEQAARSDETAARERLVHLYTDKIAAIKDEHAAEQQIKENDFATKLQVLEASKRTSDATAVRLRDQLAAFTASDRAPGETDAAAVQRFADRLSIIGGLLGESISLVTESRTVIERRDAEVGRLLDQITIDRKACSAV